MFKASILSPTSAVDAPVGSFLLANGQWHICVDLGGKMVLTLTGGNEARLQTAAGDPITYLTPSLTPAFEVEIPNLHECFNEPQKKPFGAALNFTKMGLMLMGMEMDERMENAKEYFFTLQGAYFPSAKGVKVPVWGWSPLVTTADGTATFYLF
ncbi:TPA: hypothetical protein UOJ25_000410 [Stenotrophomonas maltophilia]|nr:hypothetical protein [Stenotrophomonas maltophilia]